MCITQRDRGFMKKFIYAAALTKNAASRGQYARSITRGKFSCDEKKNFINWYIDVSIFFHFRVRPSNVDKIQ